MDQIKVSLKPLKPTTVSAVAACFVLLGSFHWSNHQKDHPPFLWPAEKSKARDFKDVQLWIRDRTSSSALILFDPSHHYGGRDYSRRSSFGNLREWLFTSWQYDGNPAIFNEGLKRIRSFGLNPENHYKPTPSLEGFEKLNEEVKNAFYSLRAEGLLRFSREYGVIHFVMETQKMRTPVDL